MSSRNKIHSKGRIQGQWTAVRWEIMQSAAWKQMSMGARMLYIALIKHLSFPADNNGKIFLATRKAAEELGATQRIVCVWFRELEHYGFIVMTELGTAGAHGKATRWRITDVGWGKLDGKSIEPTKDYLKWDGVLFERRNRDGSHKKGKRLNREQCSSGRGTKVLRGIEEQCSSPRTPNEEQCSSEGCDSNEEQKYSNLGQPYLHPSSGTPSVKSPWSTPQLVEMPYTDDFRALYAAEMRRAAA
jgi:hypothetical protein